MTSILKIVTASQACQIRKYKNLKLKLMRCCANIYFSWECQKQKLIPNFTKIKIPIMSLAAVHTQYKITKMGLCDEIKFLYIRKNMIKKELCNICLQLGKEWDR